MNQLKTISFCLFLFPIFTISLLAQTDNPSFKIIVGDEFYIANYASGYGIMPPGNHFIGREYFNEQTSEMMLPYDGVTVEGYVAAGYKAHTGIGNRIFYPNLMVGNDSQAGKITFNFNENFINDNNGLHIAKIKLSDCVQGYSDEGCEITVNGETKNIAPTFSWQDCTFDFECAPPTNTITISTDQGKGVGFEEIWVYLQLPEAEVKFNDYEIDTYIKGSLYKQYSFPVAFSDDIDDFDPATHLTYTLTPHHAGETIYAKYTPESGENGTFIAEIPHEGIYTLNASLTDASGCSGSYSYDFAIYPSADNFSLNWSVVNDGFIQVPDKAIDAGEMSRSWTNAIASGYSDDADLYYQVVNTDTQQPTTPYRPDVRRAAPYGEVPDGYTKYNASGIDLTKGNRLDMVLSKNGAVSDINSFYYTLVNTPTAIENIISGRDTDAIRYLRIDGTPASPADHGVIIEIHPDGRALKTIR